MSEQSASQSSELITSKVSRLEEIAETLEEGNVDLATAKELREEADDHLKTLREELDTGNGEIIEVMADDLETDS